MESTGRPRGRFFCICILCALLAGVALPVEVWAAIPKTSVNDVFYRADGNPAHGTVTIRWDPFTASDGSAVAAGVLAVKIGADGSFNVQLVPNTGAKPEGSYYKVVMKLDDGTTSEETWAVPAVAATTVAAVRATVMPASAAVQYVGRDYVDSSVGVVNADLQSFKVTQEKANEQPSFKGKPWHDITAYGAQCDGTSDDTAALQAAITAAGSSGKQVYIPGTPSSCYIANPSGITWPGGGVLTLTIAGTMKLGSTFVHPGNVVVKCTSGGGPGQFQAGGEVCNITPPSNTFTLTGAVSGTGSQTVSVSSTAGMAVGGAITIVENTSCTISSVTTTSGKATAQLSGTCHIPPGYNAAVAGVSDSTFNGTRLVTQADYVANTLTFECSGCGASSSGGTIAGPNEDKIETANITAISGSNVTAVFNNTHASGALGGIAAWWIKGSGHHELRDVSINAPSGVGVWIGGPGSGYGDGADNVVTDNVGVSCLATTCQPMEISNAIDVWVKRPTLNIVDGYGSWGLRITNTYYVIASTGGSGLITVDGGMIRGGIKLDRVSYDMNTLLFRNVIVEEGRRGALTYQPGTGISLWDVVLDHVWLQDNFHSYALSEIYYTQPAGISTVYLVKNNGSGIGAGSYTLVNQYFDGVLSDDSTVTGTSALPASFAGRTPNIKRQSPNAIDSELRGVGGNFYPSFLPFATQNVPTDPTSWSAGSCTLTTGLTGPDGSTNAASIYGNSNTTLTVYTYSGTTAAVGDYILYGAWVKGQDADLRLTNSVQQHIQFDNGGTYADAGVATANYFQNDTWHPVVALSHIIAFDGTTSDHPQLGLLCGQNTPQYWMPFMIYIPAAQAATIGVPEMMRWRQDLLHSIVPPNLPAGVLGTGEPLYLVRDPVAASEAATKNYVDSQLGATLVKTNQSNAYSTGTQDFHSAAHTLPAKSGTAASKPATCTVGEEYFATDAVAGQNKYLCTGTNTWTQQGGSGSGAAIVAKVAPTTYSGTSSQNGLLYTTSAAGMYRFCGIVEIMATGSAGLWQLFPQYTADGHGYNGSMVANVSTTAQWNQGNGCTVFYADSGTTINWYLSANGVAGSPTARYGVTLEQLQ